MSSKQKRPAASSAGKVEVRGSAVHGRGVFAIRPLRAAELIGFYTGRLYVAAEVAAKSWDPHLTYVFGLSDGAVIDASEGGNDTRFINHSCEPNCIAYEVETAAGLAIEIRAERPIRAGQELSLDYGLDIADNEPTGYACRCAASTCRGSMVAKA